jgi:hypothetical protein
MRSTSSRRMTLMITWEIGLLLAIFEAVVLGGFDVAWGISGFIGGMMTTWSAIISSM